MAGAITVRLGTVAGEGGGIVWDVDLSRLWDGVAAGAFAARIVAVTGGTVATRAVCPFCETPQPDLRWLWDGVALWVALDGWDGEIESEFSIRGRRAGILDRLPGLGGREPGI